MIDVTELKRLDEAATPGPPKEFTEADWALAYALRNALPDIIAALTPAGGMETTADERATWKNTAEQYENVPQSWWPLKPRELQRVLRDFSRLQAEVRRLSTPPDDVAGLVERVNKSLEVPASLMGGESFIINIDDVRALSDAVVALSAKVKEVEGYRRECERQYQEKVAAVIFEQDRAEAAEAALAVQQKDNARLRVVMESTRQASHDDHIRALTELREKTMAALGPISAQIMNRRATKGMGDHLAEFYISDLEPLCAFLASLEKETGK